MLDSFSFFFFLLIPRPPRSTLFPYTDALPICRPAGEPARPPPPRRPAARLRGHPRAGVLGARSEEHTSELQSLRHLVCRLLLEKKKITSRVWRSVTVYMSDSYSAPSTTH